jgi:hypothetical protein
MITITATRTIMTTGMITATTILTIMAMGIIIIRP